VKVGHALIAVLCGALLATQGWINGQLGTRIQDGLVAAASSTVSGFVVLAAGVLASPVGRRGLARLAAGLRKRELLWWQCLAGRVARCLSPAKASRSRRSVWPCSPSPPSAASW